MRSILLIPVTLLLLLSLLLSGSEARTIMVGVYENEPMMLMDEQGKPEGFYIDVLGHIASLEDWELSYVVGTRSECMAWLREGKIDILPGIALAPDSGEFALTDVNLLYDWGQICSQAGSPIETIAGAAERTVAVVRDDHLYREFRATLESLGLDCHFVEVDGYDAAFRMVREGVVDGCLVPSLYASGGVHDGVRHTALVNLPLELRFGVSGAAEPTWGSAIDTRLAEMRDDRGSAYYRAQSLWFGGLSVGRLPKWGNWAHIAAVAFLVTLLLASIFHRRQVRIKTRELQDEVDDRRRAEDALRASEERFHTLYDKMNEGVCLHEMIFDESGHAVDYVVLDFNPSYEAILGLGRDEIIGKRGKDLFDTEAIPFMEAFADVAATERHTTFDAYFPPARRHFRVSAFSPESGKVAAIFSDVTESKEQMDELKTSEGKYRILFENAPDPMYLNDLSGTLVEGNKAAEELLGYSRQELIGENVLKAGLLPIEQTLKAANNISLCAQGKATGPDEFTLIRKDGTHAQTEISTHPVKVDGQTLALGIVRDITARKNAEESLRESEERLRAVYESMGDSVIISDLNGNIQQVNRSAVSMLGYVSKEELLGSHAYLCVAEEDRQRASEEMMRALKMNERIVDEYKFLKKGGGTVACQVDVDLLRDKDGNAIGFVMLAHDVTDRKERDQAMEDDISKYRSLLEGLDEAVFRVGLPIGKYDYVSPAVKRVFGYTSEEFLKNPLLMRKLIHPDYSRHFNEMWKDLIQGHIQPSYEYKVLDREDKVKWVLQTNRRVFNEAGKVLAIEGIWRDITEQKQVHESIRENEVHFRKIFEASSTALQCYDDTRTLVLANPACFKLLGVDDLRGLSKLNLLEHDSTPDEVKSNIESSGKGSWRTTWDFAELRDKGSLEGGRSDSADFEIKVSPIDVGGDSTPWYLVEIHSAGEVTGTEAPVVQPSSLDSAARLARAMAQDFNGVLTGIMGYSEHLSGELADNESLHNEVDEIRKAAEAAVMRTRQLLTFSRAAAVKSEPLDLNAVIVQCQAGLGRTLGEDKNLEVKLDPSVGEVRADREQVETMLDSLVANAGDAMEPGSTLTIETRAVDLEGDGGPSPEGRRAGHFACLTVADQGSGIEEDVLGRIFEPFFTTREGKSGMGLSVVYGSVRQHSGWVEVSSEVGRGTEFNLFFPAQAAKRKSTEREHVGAARLQGGGEKVLIVEDDEIVRTMAAKVLRDRGYTVSAVGNAGEAREKFEKEQHEFDLVFTDIVLPDASGLDLADELRSREPGIKILVTSGYTDKQSQMADLAEKNFPLLEKPYALFDLLNAIKESLGQPVGAES
jgi:PAS domain S-box-containing protein